MTTFSINNGATATVIDTTPEDGIVIDFTTLDNSFGVQVNGVDLFVGGPAGAPNELEFQTNLTEGQTVRFANGDLYGDNTPQIWQLEGDADNPVVRLQINPDGTIELFGSREDGGPLEPLELFNGQTVNTAAIAAAWNDSADNTIVISQAVTGPTIAEGDVEDVEDAVCFSSGTLIETLRGPVRVENLQVGDQVLTYDNGHKPIRWIGSRRLSNAQLQANSKLKPILIRADALGAGYPKDDLIVSPQHRVLVSSVIAKRMFDSNEVLIPANKLLPLNGVEVITDTLDGVDYWHMLFDGHEIVWSNGTPTESLFTGPEALKAVSPESRVEIETLFPEILELEFTPISARYIPEKGRLMKELVQRHHANRKPVFNPSL